jgi:hypothetical protein
MNNKENKSQPNVALHLSAKVFLNIHHPPAKSTKGAMKSADARSVIPGAMKSADARSAIPGAPYAQRHVLVHIQITVII